MAFCCGNFAAENRECGNRGWHNVAAIFEQQGDTQARAKPVGNVKSVLAVAIDQTDTIGIDGGNTCGFYIICSLFQQSCDLWQRFGFGFRPAGALANIDKT